MARQFKPTDGKQLFVGRTHEFAQIDQVLETGKPQWQICVQGDGGIGKTRLLEALRERMRKRRRRKWLCTELIDFHNTSNQTEFGLLAEIARQLGAAHFAQFEKQLQNFSEVLTQNPDASLYQEAVHRVAEAFFEGWRELLRRGERILLLFDTCEEMHDLAGWVARTFLPQLLKIQEDVYLAAGGTLTAPPDLPHQTVAVWAGRTSLQFPQAWQPYVLSLELPALELNEVKEFFQLAECQLKPAQLKQLNERCGGRPLYIALSYEWLRNGRGVVDNLLDNHQPFGARLVNWIEPLKDPQSEAIVAATFAWRRMEPGLLAALLDMTEPEAQALLEELGRFSFVKYRPADTAESNFQLHDEMRELVKRHVASRVSAWETQALLEKVVRWYEKRIGDEKMLAGQALPKTDAQRALLAEYTYYVCELDPVAAGSQLGERLFKYNVHYLNLSFCELLNHELSRFEKRLPNARIDQLRFQQALVAFRREDYALASRLWHSLLRRPDCDPKLQATSHMMLVELEAYTGIYQEAEEHAEAAENLYKILLRKLARGAEAHNLVAKELGQVYNNRGYVYRIQGNLEKALHYYQKALKQGGTEKNIARCLNNIGYVYFLQGDTEKALTYVGKALQLRQKLKIAYESGLGSNTMGMLLEGMGRIDDAADLYRKAYFYFEAAGSDRGLALVQISRGRLSRITNAFDRAFEYLTHANEVLARKGDNAYRLIALNELGCAYRQQATPEARREAQKYLLESLALSEKINNYQAMADNLDDLQILFYQWAADFKKQGKAGQAADYLSRALQYGQEAKAIAKKHRLKMILANIERMAGEIDFEKQDYDKAFRHYLHACQIVAEAVQAKSGPAMQLQQRLAENANRLQQKLHALPKPEETQKYATTVLGWVDDLPKEIGSHLSILRTFLQETLQLSRNRPLVIS